MLNSRRADVLRLARRVGDVHLGNRSGVSRSITRTEISGHEFVPVTSNSKGLADGSGWIAHLTGEGLMYLLAYPDIQPSEAAPGEAEIELFTGQGSGYVEMETQGALTSVAPGGTLVWTVRWKLRQLPFGGPGTVARSALASFAESQLAQ